MRLTAKTQMRASAAGRRLARAAACGLAVAALTTAVVVTGAGSALADGAGGFVAAANGARVSSGVAPLDVASDLVAAADRQASFMAASGVLAHTPNLATAICCWTAVGENVGEGPSVSSIQAAFMASPDHRANILNHAYTQIGVGTAVDSHGTLWVSEIFRRPASAAAPAAPRVVTRVIAVAPPVHVAAAVVQPPAPAVTTPPAAPTQPAALTGGLSSRDLDRAPLAVAQALEAQLVDSGQIAGADPVSRLLDFAASASGS